LKVEETQSSVKLRELFTNFHTLEPTTLLVAGVLREWMADVEIVPNCGTLFWR